MVHTRDMRELLSPGSGGFQIVDDPNAPEDTERHGAEVMDDDGEGLRFGPRAGEDEEEESEDEEGEFEFDEFDDDADDDAEDDEDEEFEEGEDDADEFDDDDDDVDDDEEE